jgi:hypothetical protein
MAKQVIILSSSTLTGGMTSYEFAFWIVPLTAQVVPNPGFVSAFSGASGAEISALQAGTTVEVVQTTSYPTSFSLASIEADLLTKYTAAQSAYTSGVNPIQYYGTYYDGVLASWTQQSLSVVPLLPSVFAETTWNNSTTINTNLPMSISQASSLTVAFIINGTVAGGNIFFEVSVDNVNWFQIQGTAPVTYGTSSSWTTSVGTFVLSFNVAGYAYFRTILTSLITGSGSVTIVQQASSLSSSSIVTVGQPVAAYLQATATGPTLTKGTQGSTGFSVQELKDAGRTPVILYVDSLTGITTEALATLNINKGGTTSSATSYTVTAGKTLRVQAFTLTVVPPSTTACASRARVRSAATVSASSPVFINAAAGSSNVAFFAGQLPADVPDGLEFAGGVQIGISHIESSAIAGSTTTGAGVSFCLIGYEY